MVKGTKAETVIKILHKIPLKHRKKVKEVTLDMAGNMGLIVKKSFPNATLVIDRFHVQKLALDALQEIRIKHRWEAIDTKNDAIEYARNKSIKHSPKVLSNGDTLKQLLARSRYLLYKLRSKSTDNQVQRAAILFEEYPDLEVERNIIIPADDYEFAELVFSQSDYKSQSQKEDDLLPSAEELLQEAKNEKIKEL
jgi:transposase